MTLHDWFITAVILVLLCLSGFFSGSETSLTAASRPRLHRLAQQGDRRARIVNRLWERKERMIGGILLGNNLVNILASALTTSLMIRIFGDAGVVYATLVVTAVVLVFGEVMPKTFALHHSDRVALAVAPVLSPLVALFGPVTVVVEWLVNGVLRAIGANKSAEDAERWEEELRGAIDLHQGDEEEIRHEREMLRSILDLGDVTVQDILVHRSNVVMLDADEPTEELVEQALNSPYTRLPLYRGSTENVVGVLHAKALFRAVKTNEGRTADLDLVSIASPAWFIPDSTDLLAQLQAFRSRKEHFALVVDEYGAFMGIVTLEDILEEIVGDISDEHDVKVEGLEVLPDGTAVTAGSVTIRDLNRRCGWMLPDEDAATVAGLVLHEARRIPDKGQTFVFHGFRFEILERQRNQLTLIKVSKLDPGQEGDEGADRPS